MEGKKEKKKMKNMSTRLNMKKYGEGKKKLRDYGENEFCMKVLLEEIFLSDLHSISPGVLTLLYSLLHFCLLSIDRTAL